MSDEEDKLIQELERLQISQNELVERTQVIIQALRERRGRAAGLAEARQ